ncbi:MAG: protein kinase [Pseudomonadota bacterium]
MRVLVADTDSDFRAELGSDLHALGRISVVETTESPHLQAADDIEIDLIFVERALIPSETDPFSWIRAAVNCGPPVIVVDDEVDGTFGQEAEDAGASGYFAKHDLHGSAVRRCISELVTHQETGHWRRARREDLQELQNLKAPVIDGYRIIRPLGSGGSASVYLAETDLVDERVVLKVLRSDGKHLDTKGMQRFEREYQIVANLNCRNIVDIYDFRATETLSYLVIEYFPCGDLSARMCHPIRVTDCVQYVREIAQALDVIHNVNVLHRDLKPANIMLREDNSLALIDFGLAKPTDASDSVTATGELRGTPFYVSPEQLLSGEVSERSDFYSLGIIFFEMLTGSPPYVGEKVLEVLEQHVQSPVPTLPRGLTALQPLLDKFLAKDPDHRVQNAAQVQRLLDCVAFN